MDERSTQEVLKEMVQGINASPALRARAEARLASRPVRSRSWRRYGLVLSAAGAVLAVAIWPRPTSAAGWEQVTQALKDVKSMHATLTRTVGKHVQKDYLEVWYQDGMWRRRANTGPLTNTLYRDGKGYSTQAALPYISSGSGRGNDSKMTTVLDYVISGEASPLGYFGVEPTTTTSDNGGPTYTVRRAWTPDTTGLSPIVVEVVVDRATNLPKNTIWTHVDAGYNNIQVKVEVRYEFNGPISETVFDPRFGTNKPLVDDNAELREVRSELNVLETLRYRKQILRLYRADFDSTGILHVVTAREGELAWPRLRPIRVEDETGREYVTALSTMGIAPELLPGQEVRELFGPLVPFGTGKLPAKLTIVFAPEQEHLSGEKPDPKPADYRELRVNVEPGSLATNTAYARVSGMDKDFSTFSYIDILRGDWFVKVRRLADAVPYYQRSYETTRTWWPRIAHERLVPLIETLEKLGRTDEANRWRKVRDAERKEDPYATPNG